MRDGPLHSGCDPERIGGIRWVERTGGALTPAERRRLVAPILRGQANGLVGRLALMLGRRASSMPDVPAPPDSLLARAAEDAAADQGAVLLGHAHRTWAYGRALAVIDGVDVDEELFYVACLLHDAGLTEAVAGQDFTLRSAAACADVARAHRSAPDVEELRDGVTAHTTPGASVDTDGPIACYVQAGATCDLGGLRLVDLTARFVDDLLVRHPSDGLADDIIGRIRAEAEAVQDGRFALLRRTGFTTAIRLAPF